MVHPGKIDEPSLAAALLFKYGKEGLSWAGGADRPGIVHRLDKDTSGIMVIARTDAAHEQLKVTKKKQEEERELLTLFIQKQFLEHTANYIKLIDNFNPSLQIMASPPSTLQKKYITVIAGKPKDDHGFIIKVNSFALYIF